MTALEDVVARFVADTAAFDRPVDQAARNATQFGRTTERAAMTARRALLTAADAADKAASAQEAAARAAERFERGQISAAEAARLAERATRDLERANLVEREAQIAAADAADKAADNYRQIARDAELAAAAQHLAALKAVGAVDEHNSAVKRLRDKYGELEKVGGEAFKEIERTGNWAFRAVSSAGTSAFNGVSKAATSLAESGPGMIALIVGALAAVPVGAALAEGAITLGVGGALAGLGLMAAKGDSEVQAALRDMTSHIKGDTKLIAEPFKATWLTIAKDGKSAFDSLEPELSRDFDELAPVISRFAHNGAVALEQFAPAFHAATDGASALLDALGPDLPDITHNLASAIEIMAHSAGENATEISHMIVMITDLLPPLAHMLDLTVKAAPTFSPFFDVMANGLDTLRTFGGGVDWLTGGLTHLGHGFTVAGGSFPAFDAGASQASQTTSQLDKDMQTLAADTATAADKANALTDAFKRLLDPEKAVFEDSAKLKDRMSELTKELKQSHGAMNDNSAAARTAKESFTKMLTIAESLASDMLTAGDSVDTVRTKMAPYISSMYKAAGANKEARNLVDAFVHSLGLVPPKKGTTISVPGATSATRQVNAVRSALNALHDKQINITTYYRQVDIAHRTNQAERGDARGNAHGGYIGYAAGGPIARMAVGGPSGPVRGPGTATSDSIPVRLSNGEYVINAEQTAKYRPLLDAINYKLDGFAKGGGIKPLPLAGGYKAITPWIGQFGFNKKSPFTGIFRDAAEVAAERRVAKARSTREYAAAMASQGRLQDMRRSVYGGFFRGAASVPGYGHDTLVQHVTNVTLNVQGSIRSDRDLVAMVQQQLLNGRKNVTLPAGR